MLVIIAETSHECHVGSGIAVKAGSLGSLAARRTERCSHHPQRSDLQQPGPPHMTSSVDWAVLLSRGASARSPCLSKLPIFVYSPHCRAALHNAKIGQFHSIHTLHTLALSSVHCPSDCTGRRPSIGPSISHTEDYYSSVFME